MSELKLPQSWVDGPRYPIVYCWHCGAKKDSAWSPTRGPQKPKAGDIAICVECQWPAIYTGFQLEQRQPTDAELAALMKEPEVIQLMMRAALIKEGS